MRQRLRPAHDPVALQRLYGRGDEPGGHADHRLRIPVTIEIGAWLINEHDLSSIADLSAGYDALVAAGILARCQGRPLRREVGDYGEMSDGWPGARRGLIEDTVGLIDPCDLFVCSETVEHLDDPDVVLKQIRDKAGHLLLTTPVGSRDDPTPGHYWAWDRGDVEEMMAGAGFREIDCYIEVEFGAPDLFQRFGIWGVR